MDICTHEFTAAVITWAWSAVPISILSWKEEGLIRIPLFAGCCIWIWHLFDFIHPSRASDDLFEFSIFLVLLLISNFSVQLLPQLGFIAVTKIMTKRKSGKKWFIWLIGYCPLMCMIVMRMCYGDLLYWRVHLDLLTYPYEEHPDHSLPNGKRKPTANRNCSKMFPVSHHFLRALLKYDLLSFFHFLPLFTNKIHLSV